MVMKIKIAVAGFRHGHIFSLLSAVKRSDKFELAGCCEEDAATREKISANLQIDWNDYQKMLNELDCDAVAIGDYYGKRGAMAIAALKAGKHVIADKPLCTSLEEYAEISKLAAEKNLKVGLMLDLRDNGNVIAAKKLIDAGRIGTVKAINFTGQHPLNYGTRAEWYFEPGKHGGTINDIGIHGIDLVEFFSGSKFSKVIGARVWNQDFPEVPEFQNGAQFVAELENGAGVIADVSYFSHGTTPSYWRFNIWGSNGTLEFNYVVPGILAQLDGAGNVTNVYPAQCERTYLDCFAMDIAGEEVDFNTAAVLGVTERTLKIQAAAEAQKGFCTL